MRASARTSEPVYEERRPILSSLRPAETPGSPRLDQERGDAALGLGEDDRQLRDPAVRDVALLAVQHPSSPSRRALGAHRADVRAALRLGDRDGGEAALLRRQHRQVALLLLLGAEPQQRPDGELRRADRRRQAGAAPGELLGDERGGDGVDLDAAVLARDPRRRQPEPRRLREQVGGKSSFASHSDAIGRSSFAANSCASSRSSRCSGVSVKEIPCTPCASAQLACRSRSHDRQVRLKPDPRR